MFQKNGSNVAVPGNCLHGSGAVGVNLWKRELGGGWVDTQGPDGIPHRAAQGITGMTAKHGAGGEWGYPVVQ